LSKTTESTELASLRVRVVQEKERVDRLLKRVDQALGKVQPRSRSGRPESKRPVARRPSPLDHFNHVACATKDLRGPNGNLSADLIAKLYGISLSQLADWLSRTKQAVSKTPAADSLQEPLSYFERVARLRLVTDNDADFRKWLRMPHDLLGNRRPLDLMAKGEWQAMADYVDDALSGAPT
jgi:uncharacterized protein (DUF2384 family)